MVFKVNSANELPSSPLLKSAALADLFKKFVLQNSANAMPSSLNLKPTPAAEFNQSEVGISSADFFRNQLF